MGTGDAVAHAIGQHGGVTFNGLPGAKIIAAGLADLSAGHESDASLWVLIGAPRLRRVGINVPTTTIAHVEHRLYERLAAADADGAHARYNALIRRLVSFERTAECAR